MTSPAASRANLRVGVAVGGLAALMLGLAFASPPLYRLFCEVTGYGGTPQRSAGAPGAVGERMMSVRFNADIGGTNLPWTFEPVERQVEVKVGEARLVHYRARNNSSQAVTGTATFNVTPAKAGKYFDKIACFCFTEQRLEAGESIDLPVSFYIDPEIVKDANLDDLGTITLSYTFFRAKGNAEARKEEAGSADPSPRQAQAAN
ncbi:MAG: cytochrome c oxidase assembly protein [Pseudomonadota bacterium]